MSDDAVRTPEAARRLGIETKQVYDLIFTGELDAAKGPDGLVYVRTASLDDYKRRQTSEPRRSA